MAEPQSSLSTFQQQLDDQLTCSVCLDQYTNPKTLPCHHSFCLKCIEPLPIEIKVINFITYTVSRIYKQQPGKKDIIIFKNQTTD